MEHTTNSKDEVHYNANQTHKCTYKKEKHSKLKEYRHRNKNNVYIRLTKMNDQELSIGLCANNT